MTIVLPRFGPGGTAPTPFPWPGTGGGTPTFPGGTTSYPGFEPPIGATIPGTPFGGGVCPPGTRCVGPSINVGGGLQVCLGTCSPYAVPPTPQEPTGATPTVPGFPIAPEEPYPTGAGAVAAGLGCQAGYRPNKSSYYLKGGQYVPKGSRCVRVRRRDVGNIRALRKADRRIDGFVGVARSALKHTGYKVVSKGYGRARGSRGVITRAEAARAFRV